MSNVRITYVGPGVSGRRVSLTAVLRRFAPGAPPVFGNHDRTFVMHDAHLVVAVASKRSLYRDPRNPEVREELDRLATSAGFVFVVDSQRARVEAGLGHLARLWADLVGRGIDLDTIPVVFQLNKRDLPNLASVAELTSAFRTGRCTYVESEASNGRGVVEAFEAALSMIR